MRLFATISSERAKKSQGGNDHIAFELTDGRVPVLSVLASIVKTSKDLKIIVRDLTHGTEQTIVCGDQTKGERQKGEWCEAHGTMRQFCPTDPDEQKYH